MSSASEGLSPSDPLTHWPTLPLDSRGGTAPHLYKFGSTSWSSGSSSDFMLCYGHPWWVHWPYTVTGKRKRWGRGLAILPHMPRLRKWSR